MYSQRKDRGITLIELLVVMVIVAMFATLVGQNLFKRVDKARITATVSQIKELEGALDLFRLDVGRYPNSEEGLQALRIKPNSVANWDGPYLKREIPMDQWGRPYVYRFPGQHGEFDLFSLASDGQEGGEGDGADIVNWK